MENSNSMAFFERIHLDLTGSFHGVTAGTGGKSVPIHVQLNLESMKIELVNRGRTNLNVSSSSAIVVDVFDIWSKHKFRQYFSFEHATSTLGSVSTSRDALSWPSSITDVSFVRIRSCIENVRDNWYWMRRINGVYSNDYSALGAWRDGKYGPTVKLDVNILDMKSPPNDGFLLRLKVMEGLVFYPTFTARNHVGDRVLPLFVDHMPMVILEGEELIVHLSLGKTAQINARGVKTIDIDMWAGERKTLFMPSWTSLRSS